MPDAFNPYAEWLGLPADLTEPNHYQLLGLPDFEEDTARIAVAAERAMSRVRSFRPGANTRAWSKLLDELLLAKGKLLDADRKREYDKELRETGGRGSAPASSPAPAPAAAAPSPQLDPRYPPGMGPNASKTKPAEPVSQASPPAEPAKRPEPAAGPVASAPAPVSPASPAAPAPADVAPSAAAAPATPVAPAAPVAVPVAPAGVANVPPTAWPSSMLHPTASAPGASAPGTPVPPVGTQPAPVAQPPYGAGVAPVDYSQPGYAQPGYPQPAPAAPVMPQQYPGMPPYGMPPGAYGPVPVAPAAPYAPPQVAPYAAPGYPQPAAYGQPYAAPPPAPPPAEPPVSDPFGGIGAFKGPGSGLGGTMFGPSSRRKPSLNEVLGGATSEAPVDPMAPVAIPSSLPGEENNGRNSGLAAGPTAAIPKGKVVSPAASSVGRADRPAGPSLAGVKVSSGPTVPAPIVPMSTTPPPNTSKADKLILYGAVAGVVLLIGAIAFAISQGNKVNREVAFEPTVPTTPASKPASQPKTSQPTKPIMPAIKPADRKVPEVKSAPPVPPPSPMPQPPEATPPVEVKPNRPANPPEMKPEEMKPDSKPEEMKPEEMTPAPKPPEPAPPEPAPPPMEVKLTPAELMALSNHLKSAREALRERNFSETETHLDAAFKLAKSDEQIAKTQRLKLVADYVKQFDRSLKTLLADENFDAGAELTIGTSTRVVVVERSPTMIVIRINGMNKSYSLASLPDGLAMALIDQRLDPNDPVTKIIKASYLAAAKVATEDNIQKAKALWEEARVVDPEGVGDLPLFLTDTYDFKE